MKLSNLPYKGTADLWGDSYAVQQYIFKVWRDVCERFNYQPYLTPLLEPAEVYRAKSGEDVGGKELFTLQDLAKRELAIRPEMTPSVTRMVTRFYPQEPKPIRLYSIANFMRNERPQRGRNREFWQLNVDIFGDTSLGADLEILLLALEIMKGFEAKKEQFTLYVNSRILIEGLLNSLKVPVDTRSKVVRILDKLAKLDTKELTAGLQEFKVPKESIKKLVELQKAESSNFAKVFAKELSDNQGWKEVQSLITQIKGLGYDYDVQFAPHLIRGFDYYDGMIFEVFDNNPDNNRSLFGGGRYNGLAGLFGSQTFPAVGFAPGDEPLRLFLESWKLVPKDLIIKPQVFVPQLLEGKTELYWQLTQQIRAYVSNVEMSTSIMPINKALSYANQKGFQKIVLVGDQELAKDQIVIKDLNSGEQQSMTQDQLPYFFKD